MRKSVKILMLLALFAMNSYIAQAMLGDLVNDGELHSVELNDAIYALQVVSGVRLATGPIEGDVASDDEINLKEVIYILRTLAGIAEEIPAAPEAVEVVPNDQSLTVSWNNNSSISYNIYYSTSANFEIGDAGVEKYKVIFSETCGDEAGCCFLTGDSAICRIGGLSNGQPYYVAVTSVNYAESGLSVIASATPAVPLEILTPGNNMVFVKIPEGEFIMGSPDTEDGRNAVDEIQHKVHLSSFYMLRTEVTQAQWNAVMGVENNPSPIQEDSYPVYNVSYSEVQQFIGKLNSDPIYQYRLSTEAEWEYASKEGKDTRSITLGDVWYSGSSTPAPASPRSTEEKGYNAFGLYDTLGNVYEWCQDAYGAYEIKPITINPVKESPTPTSRVIRGGSWACPAANCRDAHRVSLLQETRDIKVGFRLVVEKKSEIIEPLPPPSNLRIALKDGGVTLVWDPVPGATGYNIYQNSPASSTDVVSYSGEDVQFSFPPEQLKSGETYNFVVAALSLSNDQIKIGKESQVKSITEMPEIQSIVHGESRFTFVKIPKGTFKMGSLDTEPGRYTDEVKHDVTFTKDFYLMTTEVTQAQWLSVMGGENPSYNNDCTECPVEQISWYDVQDFITKLKNSGIGGTFRLPTEAEWEYAARAGTQTAFSSEPVTNQYNQYNQYCGSNPALDSVGWYCGNSGGETHPVAMKAPNAWGIHDMHGNVWEWTSDWYGNYPTTSVTDPKGPLNGTDKVIRGGSWNWFARSSRSANRHKLDLTYAYNPQLNQNVRLFSVGFRLAYD